MYTKKSGRMTYKSNRRPTFKRNSNFVSKGRNKGNVTQQYNKYLKLAKDTFSAGDRIQAEYYYQFTDHYYRLMQEMGINIDDQETSTESKNTSENVNSEEDKEVLSEQEENSESNKSNEEDIDQSIQSIPFISEPVKKKRSKNTK